MHLSPPLAPSTAADGARLTVRDAQSKRARAGGMARCVQLLEARRDLRSAASLQVVRAGHEQDLRWAHAHSDGDVGQARVHRRQPCSRSQAASALLSCPEGSPVQAAG